VNNLIKTCFSLVALSVVSGCATMSIGEEEGCGRVPNGATCVSAKDVYLMTNHRNHLEDMSPEELAALRQRATGKTDSIHVEKDEKPTLSEFFGIGSDEEPRITKLKAEPKPMVNTNEVVTPDALENARDLKLKEMLRDEQSIYRTEAKMLRMQFAKWEDEDGRLHDPGKIYVEIEGRKWITGRQQVANPKVITPLAVKKAINKKTKKSSGQ